MHQRVWHLGKGWMRRRKPAPEKSQSEITKEIQAIIRQVLLPRTSEPLKAWISHAGRVQPHTELCAIQSSACALSALQQAPEMLHACLCMQITASVTFLPLLNDRCSFDLLVYTDAQSAVPMEWWAPAQ